MRAIVLTLTLGIAQLRVQSLARQAATRGGLTLTLTLTLTASKLRQLLDMPSYPATMITSSVCPATMVTSSVCLGAALACLTDACITITPTAYTWALACLTDVLCTTRASNSVQLGDTSHPCTYGP